MGLAASQARLLSITARLNHNELESMVTTNAKLRLADKSDAASDKYMEAMNSTKFEYMTYNTSGQADYVGFTFGTVNKYSSMKNQYIFKNAAGQVYVNSADANNFATSNDLYEFLDKYGLFDQSKNEFQDRLDEYNKQKDEYEKQMQEYEKQKADYEQQLNDYTSRLEEYNKKLEQYNKDMEKYQEEYQKYLDSLNAPDLYGKFSGIVGTSDNPTAYCYREALRGDSGCYLHLLNLLLDFNGSSPTVNTYTASNGKSVTTNGATGGMGTPPAMKEVSDALNEVDESGNPTRVCDGDDDLNTSGAQNILEAAKNAGRAPTELEILRSDYIDNGDGTYSKKSLKQKAIDMYYILQNLRSEVDASDMKNMLINFTDGDMQKLTLTPPVQPTPPDPFTEEMPEFDLVAPKEPEAPVYIEKIYDKPLAQWYINLWYAMDASDKSDELYTIHEEGEAPYYTVPDIEKETTERNKHYVVMDSDNAADSEWLQNSLAKGMITISQARTGDAGEGISWQAMEYSNVTELVETEDTAKIAKAEAEYQEISAEIQAKDKEFDIELKKLDTEHNALQQQYDSIKSVIDKNTERSFKLFS